MNTNTNDPRTFWNRDRGCADLIIFGLPLLFLALWMGACS